MILQVFNKYLQMGGEEKSVERIRKHAIEAGVPVEKCFFDSADWQGEAAPGKLNQLKNLFYNHSSAELLNLAIDKHKPSALLLHNIYPVGSPAILDVAQKRNVPVIQYVHNFRPFSVGGTLYAKGKYLPESLDGNFLPEVLAGAWQNSVLKSAIMATMLKRVQSSGWLENVKAWVCISEYMAEAFARAGVPENRLHVLRHSWDAKVDENTAEDKGYYLFLSRLTEEKGVSFLLQCWSILSSLLDEKTPQLIIAGDGPLRSDVEAKSSTSKHIQYVGLVQGEQKENLISECRAMLAPSLWKEPLGLVTYEAQDYSKAMFCAASGGLSETTEHEVTGFIHQPGNVDELVQQIISYENYSPKQRETIEVAARMRLLDKAAPENWKQAFTKVVNTVTVD